MAPSRQANGMVVKKCLAAAAVLTLTAVLQPAGTAFASAPLAIQGADVTAKLAPQQATPALRPAVASMQQPRAAANWSSLGSAALLCATAAVALQALQQRARPARTGRCVVACQASAAPVAQQVSFAPEVPVVSAPTPVAPAAPCLLDTPVPTVSVQTPQPVSPAPAQPTAAAPLQSFFMAADDEEVEVPTLLRSVADTTRRPARFVAGARLPGSPRAGKSTSPRTTRSARRAVGARLVAKPQYQQAPEPSFDSSRVRMQIQVGLRSSSRVCSEQAREFKTPAAVNVGQAAKVLNITFRSMHYDDHNKTFL